MIDDISQHLVHGKPEPERDRHLVSIDPTGYEVIEKRVPSHGERFADGHGADAWIYEARAGHIESQLIVRPT